MTKTEMKKIGVCACYNTKNYGSMLQTLATCRMLEALGYDYEIINYTRKPTLGLILRSLGRIPEKMQIKKARSEQGKRMEAYPDVKSGIRERDRCFDIFMTGTFTKMSSAYDTFAQLQKAAREYDAVLVGSDQLWLPQGYSTGFYTLMFVPDEIPKIAYATSFGVSEIPENKKRAARIFLNRIGYISVRELRGSQIVKELTGRDVPTVVDPTLLFDSAAWEKIIPRQSVSEVKDKEYIFCYMLGNNPEQRKAVKVISERKGLPVVFIPHLDEFIESDVGFGDYELYHVGPAEFINLIRHASYVCTDSFHGSVFSILHHKQFVTFNRFKDGSDSSRNSRIESLLEQTGLMSRRVNVGTDADILIKLDAEIDYFHVDQLAAQMRERSVSYLKEALSESCHEETDDQSRG